MRGILADNDVCGQVAFLVALLQAEPWHEFWEALHLTVFQLEDFGLAATASDRSIWQRCQAEAVVLITANRTGRGSTSLDATIREHNAADCLPVLTISDPQRFKISRAYVEEVVETLLEYLQGIESLRGTGRLYLP